MPGIWFRNFPKAEVLNKVGISIYTELQKYLELQTANPGCIKGE
jgi:hypothetical protein